MEVLCEYENQKLTILIVNYYFYFQTKQFELKIIFILKQCIFCYRGSIKLLIFNERYSENIVNMVN